MKQVFTGTLHTFGEWFDTVWYVALMPKHTTALEKKIKKATVSAHVNRCPSNAYRDREMKKKTQAPKRWEWILTDSLCRWNRLWKEVKKECDVGR